MPNTPLICPRTGTTVFGAIGEMKSRGVLLPAGDIHLLRGKHTGPNRGFGARHIWAEHAKEMAIHGLLTEADVPVYVSLIIQFGTPLFYEGGYGRNLRIMAVRALPGTAILEYRENRARPFWAVVTAFAANKKHGSLVGTVL